MTEPLRVLSLFAGIGGFDLGLERTGGFKTVAFCEIEPFPQSVLRKQWPGVPIYGELIEARQRHDVKQAWPARARAAVRQQSHKVRP